MHTSSIVPIPADRFAGCLIGQALGDALGFVVEGFPPAFCREYVEKVLRSRRLVGLGRGGFSLGQYSDDTQLARELAASLVEKRGLDPADYARRVAAIFVEERIVGRGRATEEAARRIAAGVPWDAAGTPPPSAGNGSAMRVAPVGLLWAHDAGALARAAHDQGRVTHADPRCTAGAIAIAAATALLAADPALDAATLCADVARRVAPFDAVLARAVLELPQRAQEPADVAVRHIEGVGVDAALQGGWQGISPMVTPSVLWSLYSVLRGNGDYWETICLAIEPGGDVDTTAAMAGAIAGAAVGLAGIPQDAARLVTDRGTWGYDELVALATKLHAVYEARSPGRPGDVPLF